MVTVVGLGFVGLTTALGFAEMDHKVYGIEVNAERMKVIKSGRLPFLEPGLDDALTRHLGGNFLPCDDLALAVRESDAIYYCVGTPYGEGGQADLTYLFQAIEQTLAQITDGRFRVLVVKSTVPPSTTRDKVIPYVAEKGWEVGVQIGVANNPEFLREGHCWDDFTNADRIVIGVSDDRSARILRDLYKNGNGAPVFCVSLNTGEFVKYLSNTLLATMISYANEMSVAAETIGGIDIAEAFRILLMDRRWAGSPMRNYVYPGCGYGGYCLPKDTNAFHAALKGKGFDAKILGDVIRTNDEMPQVIANRVAAVAGEDKTIGVLGLSFKPNSDDVRDTPAAKILRALNAMGYERFVAYDPVANAEFQKHYPEIRGIAYRDTMDEVLREADALVILTAWEQFRQAPEKTKKPIIDGRFML